MWSKSIPAAQLMRVALKKAKIATMPTGKTGGVLAALALRAPAVGRGSGVPSASVQGYD